VPKILPNLPAESGDLEMKVKDIIDEGVVSSFVRGLLPQQLEKTMQTLRTTKRPLGAKERTQMEPEYLELAKAAHKTYGDNPQSDVSGPLGWLTDEQRKAAAKKSAPTPAPTSPPITHPDVSVISSYPLRMKYKSGDYVLDPTTNQWRTVTGKRVAPELASFLQYQASKL